MTVTTHLLLWKQRQLECIHETLIPCAYLSKIRTEMDVLQYKHVPERVCPYLFVVKLLTILRMADPTLNRTGLDMHRIETLLYFFGFQVGLVTI